MIFYFLYLPFLIFHQQRHFRQQNQLSIMGFDSSSSFFNFYILVIQVLMILLCCAILSSHETCAVVRFSCLNWPGTIKSLPQQWLARCLIKLCLLLCFSPSGGTFKLFFPLNPSNLRVQWFLSQCLETGFCFLAYLSFEPYFFWLSEGTDPKSNYLWLPV